MSVLTHTPHVFREHRAQAAYASHIAMIKRFAAFALTLVGFAVAVGGGRFAQARDLLAAVSSLTDFPLTRPA